MFTRWTGGSVGRVGRQWRRWLGILLGLALVAGPARAEVLILTGDMDWAPLSAPDEPQQGLVNAITEQAFDKVGIEADIRLLPWSRALRAAEAAQYDGLIGAFYTEERAQVFSYSEPVFEQQIVLLARRDFPLDRYDTLMDLKPYTVGIIRDNALAGGIEDADLNFDYTGTVESNVRKLATDRVDVIAGVLWRLRHQVRQIGEAWTDFKVLDPPLGSQIAYLVVSKQHPQSDRIIVEFNRGLDAIRSDGTYDALLDAFGFGPDEAPSD